MGGKVSNQIAELKRLVNQQSDQISKMQQHLDRRLDRIEELLKLLMANQLTNELSEVMNSTVAPEAPSEYSDLTQEGDQEANCHKTAISSTPHIVEVRVPDCDYQGAQLWLRPDVKCGSHVDKGAVIGVLRFSRNVKTNILVPACGELIYIKFRSIDPKERDACFSVKPGEIIAKIRCC